MPNPSKRAIMTGTASSHRLLPHSTAASAWLNPCLWLRPTLLFTWIQRNTTICILNTCQDAKCMPSLAVRYALKLELQCESNALVSNHVLWFKRPNCWVWKVGWGKRQQDGCGAGLAAGEGNPSVSRESSCWIEAQLGKSRVLFYDWVGEVSRNQRPCLAQHLVVLGSDTADIYHIGAGGMWKQSCNKCKLGHITVANTNHHEMQQQWCFSLQGGHSNEFPS